MSASYARAPRPPPPADVRRDVSAGLSEQKTEPFSQSEIEARCRNLRFDHFGAAPDGEVVPLEALRVEEHHHQAGIRILFRLHTRDRENRSVSPGSDSCHWLALRAEVASSDQPEHRVLAVTQTSRDIKFSVRLPGDSQHDYPRPPLWCELYYDPESDKIIFLNRSDVPVSLSKTSRNNALSPMPPGAHVIDPKLAKALEPGTWRFQVDGLPVLDFRILEKRPLRVLRASAPRTDLYRLSRVGTGNTNSSGVKRSFDSDDDDDGENPAKRRFSASRPNSNANSHSTTRDDNLIMFLPRPRADTRKVSVDEPREPATTVAAAYSHALLDAEPGDTIHIPGVFELDEHQITRREPIASSTLSTVFRATHSGLPDEVVIVKVLKIKGSVASDKPLAHERSVIQQADMWLRECQSQEDLKHNAIVKCYGGDARFLSIYMENVKALDLAAPNCWRNGEDGFMGNRNDATRILRDVSSALNHVHRRDLVHNDIKPTNILYSSERGAVLCDFGHASFKKNERTGGTPYYIPPEFIQSKQRGPPSDVWALGVTMLYLLRFIPYPESRYRHGHPKRLHWQIGEVNKGRGGGRAAEHMRLWLSEIDEARDKLDAHDALELLIKQMLTPNPDHRIQMGSLLQRTCELPVQLPETSLLT